MDYFNYIGKVCVVTGAASGVGRALADMLMEQGAEVWAIDFQPVSGVTHYINADLRDKEQIDAALALLPPLIDKLFSNAALPGVTYQDSPYTELEVFTVNYVAARYIIETLSQRMPEGSAITVTASVTGEGWSTKKDMLQELYEASTFEDAQSWALEHSDDPATFDGGRTPQPLYIFTKECLLYYVRRASYRLLTRGIRINSVSPGAVDTPMTNDFGKLLVDFKQFDYMEKFAHAAVGPAVDRAASPAEAAHGLLFLGSDMSAAFSGADLIVDFGFQAALDTGVCDEGGNLIRE